ncbi:MAG: isoleucine--tRNA ligase [Actinomycetes bacterium]
MTPEKRTTFTPLPPAPNHNELELAILDWWEEHRIFDRLREQNADGPLFSFVDGPVTANKTLGVHTAWGRTLKDVFQRYKAATGHHLRYQNGFDCQGLWIEVGVEQELGLNSKREIEEFGLEEFARRCRAKVAWSVEELTRGSKRLGYWMDWGNDYLTFADTNIEYIWRFLKTMHERGMLYKGHRATEWCPRCGTSISQHEITMSGVYQEKADPSLFVRLPLVDREGEYLVIWTTTPWTLPANVAAAVHPEQRYGRRTNGEWVAVERYPDEELTDVRPGAEMEGWRYRGPFDDLEPGSGVDHRVVLWDEVTMDQGTGIVHIAPGCGGEDFDLGRREGLDLIMPVDESGRFYPSFGWLAGREAGEVADDIVAALEEKGLLVEAATYVHAYPHCWRCDTPLIFRVADDWYIAVDPIREQLREANRTVEWTPAYMGKLMDDWLVNMGDWNISRRRYYGLPLPFFPCDRCGHLTVVGSKKELAELATRGMDQLEELHRPWIDRVAIACPGCGNPEVTRVLEVGDVWLDAGIVPLSTLGWENPEWIEGGYATGAARGLTNADLPDHAHWEEWFPADWVSEMREQVRLWFYSQLFMSVALVGKAPYRAVLGYEKMLAEDGREMHGSWGNLISAEEAFEKMGADVMRWMYCAHPPDRNLLFGYEGAREVQRRLLTLWNSAKFLVDYGNIEGFVPTYSDLEGGPSADLTEIDRWLLARADRAVAEARAAYERWRSDEVVEAFEAYVDDLSNWYIRRNRRRFYEYDEAAFRTLWVGLVTALRIVSPIMPFLTEHLWQVLVAGPCEDAPDSIHLAGWPSALGAVDEELLSSMEVTREIVELGRRARTEAGVKLRQPLRSARVRGGDAARRHADIIRDELRVKEVDFDAPAVVEVSYKPNFPVLGPRIGPKVKEVAAALAAGDYEVREDGSVAVAGEVLSSDEVVRTETVTVEGWGVAQEGNLAVAVDLELDEELILEGRVYDLVRALNEQRKQQGLELTDRITLRLPSEHADLVDRHGEWIAAEVLATSIGVDGSLDAPVIEKA